MTTCPDDELDLVRWIDGEATSNRSAELAAHVRSCQRCAERERGFRDLRARLRAVAPDADGARFLRELEDRLEGPRRQPRWNPLPRWVVPGAAALAVGAMLVMLAVLPRPEFQARGRRGAQASAVAAFVHLAPERDAAGARVAAGPLSAGATVDPKRGFVFRVTNRDPQRTAYFMLFGIDAASEVHWFHPAWTDSKTDPVSLRVPPGTIDRLLPEAVVPERPAPGPFRFVTLVSDIPLHVSQVEAQVARGRALAELAAVVVREQPVVFRGASP